MSLMPLELTGHLARAARALVGVSSRHVAQVAQCTRTELRDFEKGLTTPDDEWLAALRSALESLGATFIADGVNGRGHGVRLKFSSTKVEKIETWEHEGGFAADDDV